MISTKTTNWRIGTRLAVGFGAVLMLAVLMAVVGVMQLRALVGMNAAKDAAEARFAAIERWNGAINLNLTRALTIARSGWHAPTVSYLEPQIKATSAQITVLQQAVEKRVAGTAAQALFDDVSSKRKAYIDVRASASAAFKEGRADEGAKLTEGPMTTGADAYLAAVATLQQQA